MYVSDDYGREQSSLELHNPATALLTIRGKEKMQEDYEGSEGKPSLFHHFLMIIKQMHGNVW